MPATKFRVWLNGLFASTISGLGGGIINGFAAMGIAPDKFNWQEPKQLIAMVTASTISTAVIGLAMYLRQSPLPPAE